MKKSLAMAAMLLLLLGFSGRGRADVRINVGISLPPSYVFAAPPELVVIPETYVYYYPDVDFDLLFYGGYWYRPYQGYWFRSVSYEGPWVHIVSPPPVIVNLPPHYRIATRGERRIPYSELHRNWGAWERERYWEHHNWGRARSERHYGVAPSYREREHRSDRRVAPQSGQRGHGGYVDRAHEGRRYEDHGGR